MREKVLSSLKAHWKKLLKEGQEMTFRKGQVLFYEGHHPYGLFVILKGGVKFTRGGTPCSEEHLWKAPKEEVLGLEPFLEGTPSNCTSMATCECRVIFISKTQLFPYLEKACLPLALLPAGKPGEAKEDL